MRDNSTSSAPPDLRKGGDPCETIRIHQTRKSRDNRTPVPTRCDTIDPTLPWP